MKKPLPILLVGQTRQRFKSFKKDFDQLKKYSKGHKHERKNFTVHIFGEAGRPKALVAHGWMSSTVFMMNHIKHLVNEGYEVYSVDFPSHGFSKGFIFTWRDAIHILLKTQDLYGPMDIALGHSFGGGMIVNAIHLKNVSKEFTSQLKVNKAILLASALSANVPLKLFSKIVRLNQREQDLLKEKMVSDAEIEYEQMSALYLESTYPTKTKYLAIHGDQDKVVCPEESQNFAELSDRVHYIEKAGMNHVDVLYDQPILSNISDFIKN